MKKSCELLANHPINIERVKKGLNPANAVWFWGEGVRKPLASFKDKFGLNASMISAVDLLKGIGKFSGMHVVNVEGATGYLDTNFEGKAEAAAKEFAAGSDFVYVHIEAPDECGHRHEIQNKVKAIELIDQKVLAPLIEALKAYGEYRIMILPDHPTPLALRTHTNDPVPYLIYDSRVRKNGVDCFCEKTAKQTGIYVPTGHTLIDKFIKG